MLTTQTLCAPSSLRGSSSTGLAPVSGRARLLSFCIFALLSLLFVTAAAVDVTQNVEFTMDLTSNGLIFRATPDPKTGSLSTTDKFYIRVTDNLSYVKQCAAYQGSTVVVTPDTTGAKYAISRKSSAPKNQALAVLCNYVPNTYTSLDDFRLFIAHNSSDIEVVRFNDLSRPDGITFSKQGPLLTFLSDDNSNDLRGVPVIDFAAPALEHTADATYHLVCDNTQLEEVVTMHGDGTTSRQALRLNMWAESGSLFRISVSLSHADKGLALLYSSDSITRCKIHDANNIAKTALTSIPAITNSPTFDVLVHHSKGESSATVKITPNYGSNYPFLSQRDTFKADGLEGCVATPNESSESADTGAFFSVDRAPESFSFQCSTPVTMADVKIVATIGGSSPVEYPIGTLIAPVSVLAQYKAENAVVSLLSTGGDALTLPSDKFTTGESILICDAKITHYANGTDSTYASVSKLTAWNDLLFKVGFYYHKITLGSSNRLMLAMRSFGSKVSCMLFDSTYVSPLNSFQINTVPIYADITVTPDHDSYELKVKLEGPIISLNTTDILKLSYGNDVPPTCTDTSSSVSVTDGNISPLVSGDQTAIWTLTCTYDTSYSDLNSLTLTMVIAGDTLGPYTLALTKSETGFSFRALPLAAFEA